MLMKDEEALHIFLQIFILYQKKRERNQHIFTK
jgi:hypothetical protein